QQFMSERLRLLGADLDAVRWDASRSSDGTWQVTAAWQAGAKSGVTRWAYDIPARTVTPVDAATTDFAEGTRLVRVVPHVPTERPAPIRSRPVVVVPDDDGVAAPASSRLAPDEDDDPAADDDVRPVLPAEGPRPDARRTDAPADEDDISEHDTVVLGRPGGEGDDDEDPRARIPAWEDIVFGVRRHR
ncbi:MAG TPA: septation protein SepH, partial [Geodermatophilus sp.]|nr:septation protein SepH [Geodermatophilus sp.]